jgi:DNA-binding HxlR family transcriptional regulator
VTYSLTARGVDLKPAIGELQDWARRWKLRKR